MATYPRKKYEMSKGDKVLMKFEMYVVDRTVMIMRKKHYAEMACKYHNNLNTDKMATIFHCCMKGRFIHKYMFTILSNRLVNDEGYLERAQTDNLSMVLEAVGVLSSVHRFRLTLHGEPINEDARAFYNKCGFMAKSLCEVLLKREETNYKACNHEQCAQIIRGLGHLYEEDKGLYMNDEIKRLISALFKKFCKSKELETCQTREMADVLFGAGCVRLKDYGSLDKLCTEFAYRLETDVKARIRILSMRDEYGDWKEEIRERRPLYLNQMANVVWSLGVLDFCHLGVLDALGDDIRARARFFSEGDLSKILYGLGQISYRENSLLHALSMEIGVPRRLKKLNHGELANLVNGLGKLQLEDKTTMNFVEYEVDKWSERLRKMSCKELESIIEGLGASGHKEDSRVVGAAKKALEKQRYREQKESEDRRLLKEQRKKEYDESKKGPPKKKKKKKKKMIRKKGSMW